METERIALSQRERDRLRVLHEVEQKHFSQVAAAERLKVTDRQVRRMLLGIRERGDGALVHGPPALCGFHECGWRGRRDGPKPLGRKVAHLEM
jgi:hypothetical protein